MDEVDLIFADTLFETFTIDVRHKPVQLWCAIIAHLSIRIAQNTMGTGGTLEGHLGFVAPLVRGPK